jgi:hypothetical protein
MSFASARESTSTSTSTKLTKGKAGNFEKRERFFGIKR